MISESAYEIQWNHLKGLENQLPSMWKIDGEHDGIFKEKWCWNLQRIHGHGGFSWCGGAKGKIKITTVYRTRSWGEQTGCKRCGEPLEHDEGEAYSEQNKEQGTEPKIPQLGHVLHDHGDR
jgi:hypothetical protein